MRDAAIMKYGRILITGGTGFIGSALTERLLGLGLEVSVLSRDRERARNHFAGRVRAVESLDELDADDAHGVIVNLAGMNLGEQRWNPDVKERLIDSRVDTTQQVIAWIARAAARPQLLISGSAVGYYGARGNEPLTERSSVGKEYQADLCRRWENAAESAVQYGVRVCISRTGIVMGRGGGALAGLAPLFRLGLGADAGSGQQWVSWIHMHDLLESFLLFMRDSTLSGPFNNTAPNPVSNREFSRAIGRALHRPVLLRAPGWAMRLRYGELAHLYLTGQKVLPARLLQTGFEYRYPFIDAALRVALRRAG